MIKTVNGLQTINDYLKKNDCEFTIQTIVKTTRKKYIAVKKIR